MALISCPECGKEVSDQALACIHCGYPLQSFPPPKRAPRQYSLVFTGLGPHADIPAALHCLSKGAGPLSEGCASPAGTGPGGAGHSPEAA